MESPSELSSQRARRLRAVVAANLAVALVEVAGGVLGRSMALMADAGHNVADAVAVGLALGAVHLARKPPDLARSYGYHRGGPLVALANAAGILVLSVLIAVGAVYRFANPAHTRGGVVAAVALSALVVNGWAAFVLAHKAGRDLNLRAAVLHMAGDAAASGGVAMVGAVLLVAPGAGWLDPAVSLAIAVLVGSQAVRLSLQATGVLLEGTPEGTDTGELRRAVMALGEVEDVHDLHVWSLSSEVTLLSAHLVMAGHPTLEQAQAVAACVRSKLAEDFGIAHATLELECETCEDGVASPCAMADPVAAERS